MLGKKLGEAFYESLQRSAAGKYLNPAHSPIDLFNKEQRTKLMHMLGENTGGSVKSYMQGSNIEKAADGSMSWGAADEKLAKARKYTAGAAAGLLTANALGFDPFGATSGVNSLVGLGANIGIGATMYGSAHGGLKTAGLAYLAGTAVNTFRPGDNIGPM